MPRGVVACNDALIRVRHVDEWNQCHLAGGGGHVVATRDGAGRAWGGGPRAGEVAGERKVVREVRCGWLASHLCPSFVSGRKDG